MKNLVRTFFSIAVCLAALAATFFTLFAFTISDDFLSVLVVITAIISSITCILKIWNVLNNKKFGITVLVIASIFAVCYFSNKLYKQQIANIPVITEPEIDLAEYEPFAPNTKAASLDEPSTFKITSDIPVIDGATALYPLYAAFVKATYPAHQYSHATSQVRSTKTSGAYKSIIEGSVNVIFVAGPSEAQLAAAKAAGTKLVLTPIGYEAFVFFVNAKNPVNGLTSEQIKDIYSGKIDSWKEVGGSNSDILAYQRPENSGSQTRLLQLMGTTPLKPAILSGVAGGMGTMVSSVAADYKNHNNAIGYSFLNYLTGMVKNNQIKLLAIDGIYPTPESVANKQYPYITEFYAVTTEESSNPQTQQFIDWIVSPEGQELVKKTGYIPL